MDYEWDMNSEPLVLGDNAELYETSEVESPIISNELEENPAQRSFDARNESIGNPAPNNFIAGENPWRENPEEINFATDSTFDEIPDLSYYLVSDESKKIPVQPFLITLDQSNENPAMCHLVVGDESSRSSTKHHSETGDESSKSSTELHLATSVESRKSPLKRYPPPGNTSSESPAKRHFDTDADSYINKTRRCSVTEGKCSETTAQHDHLHEHDKFKGNASAQTIEQDILRSTEPHEDELDVLRCNVPPHLLKMFQCRDDAKAAADDALLCDSSDEAVQRMLPIKNAKSLDELECTLPSKKSSTVEQGILPDVRMALNIIQHDPVPREEAGEIIALNDLVRVDDSVENATPLAVKQDTMLIRVERDQDMLGGIPSSNVVNDRYLKCWKDDVTAENQKSLRKTSKTAETSHTVENEMKRWIDESLIQNALSSGASETSDKLCTPPHQISEPFVGYRLPLGSPPSYPEHMQMQLEGLLYQPLQEMLSSAQSLQQHPLVVSDDSSLPKNQHCVSIAPVRQQFSQVMLDGSSAQQRSQIPPLESLPQVPAAQQLSQVPPLQSLTQVSPAQQLTQVISVQLLPQVYSAPQLIQVPCVQSVLQVSSAQQLIQVVPVQSLPQVSSAQQLSQVSSAQSISIDPSAQELSQVPSVQSLTQVSPAQQLSQVISVQLFPQVLSAQLLIQVLPVQSLLQVPSAQQISQVPSVQSFPQVSPAQQISQVPFVQSLTQVPSAQRLIQVLPAQSLLQVPSVQQLIQVVPVPSLLQVSSAQQLSQVPSVQSFPLIPSAQQLTQGISVQSLPQVSSAPQLTQAPSVKSLTQVSSAHQLTQVLPVQSLLQVSSAHQFAQVLPVQSLPEVSSAHQLSQPPSDQTLSQVVLKGPSVKQYPQAKSVPPRFTIWRTLFADTRIRAVALLAGNIYVTLDVESDKLHSSDVVLLRPLESLPPNTAFVEEMKKVPDLDCMAACSRNKCLYVNDLANDCVLRVQDMRAEHHRYDVFRVYPGRADSLSVTSSGELFIMRGRDVSIYRLDGIVYVYNIGLRVLACLDLPTANVCFSSFSAGPLNHVVETPGGTFVLCLGACSDGVHGVCEMTKEGEVKRRFKVQPTSEEDQMKNPRHLAIDETGNVYVADYDNYRVLMLDSTLEIVSVRITGEAPDGGRPRSLCYSQDMKYLAIGIDELVSGPGGETVKGRITVGTIGDSPAMIGLSPKKKSPRKKVSDDARN